MTKYQRLFAGIMMSLCVATSALPAMAASKPVQPPAITASTQAVNLAVPCDPRVMDFGIASPLPTSAPKEILKFRWEKVAGADGYQISVNGNMYTSTSPAKQIKVARSTSAKTTITYKVRAFRDAATGKEYGKWSASRTYIMEQYDPANPDDPEGTRYFTNFAVSQIGESATKYRKWAKLSDSERWSGAFVSWCAEQYEFDDDYFHKITTCPSGANWFKKAKRWKGKSYCPSTGDIIFIDDDQNGTPGRVGIVIARNGNTITTVEGTGTKVNKKTYTVGAGQIYGYGIMSAY